MTEHAVNYKEKELVFFDMDGTLALSKSPIDEVMKGLLTQLLAVKKVVVISGGAWLQFEKQLINVLDLPSTLLDNLFIATGGGSSMYRFVDGKKQEMYANLFTEEEKCSIRNALAKALKETNFDESAEHFGERIEDRGSAIAFSALGQSAPLEKKSTWDPDQAKRRAIIEHLSPRIPQCEIRMGGMTTIDITKKGIDKAFGIREASTRLAIPIEHMLYIGDALYPGGNDEPAKASGVECVQVKDVDETKQLIREIIGA